MSFNCTVSVAKCLCRGDLSPLTWLFWCNFCLRPPCVSHLCRFVSVVCEHDGHLTSFCWVTLNLCQCLCCIRPPDCASGCLNSSFLLRCIRAALQLALVPLQSEILPHFDGLFPLCDSVCVAVVVSQCEINPVWLWAAVHGWSENLHKHKHLFTL